MCRERFSTVDPPGCFSSLVPNVWVGRDWRERNWAVSLLRITNKQTASTGWEEEILPNCTKPRTAWCWCVMPASDKCPGQGCLCKKKLEWVLMITGDGLSDRLTPDTGKLFTLGKSHLLPPDRSGLYFLNLKLSQSWFNHQFTQIKF